MAFASLEDKINNYGSAAEMLQSNPGGRFAFPIAPEFSNWLGEQEAWRKSAVLQDMSFHMTIVHIDGPQVMELISHVGINNFSGFGTMKAKQLVLCSGEGYVIGDAILTCEKENSVSLIGRPEGPTWVRYQAQTGAFDVNVTNVETPSPNLSDRKNYRYQVQGPNADKILANLNGGSLPDIKFFKMGRFNVGSHQVTALNHRMSGAPGFEFWGPSEEGESVKALILDAGQEYGLKQIGGRVYGTTATESGWLGGPVPAIYSGDSTRGYREWLGANDYAGNASIGGSFEIETIDDLYVTPWDLGYGFLMKFDHHFVGRESLEAMAKQPHHKKVRLLWNKEDVLDIAGSMLREGDRYKHMEMPVSGYATYCFDEVTRNGERVGMSYFPVYSSNVRSWISLAMINESLAVDGQELTLTWGEPDGGSAKPAVEPHVQKSVRVVVDSKPIKRD